MRRAYQALFILIAFLAGFSIFGVKILLGSSASQRAQGKQVAEGWIVCEDLGIGPVPGLPDYRQRFRLCHPLGWEYLAYCREPGLPMPPVNSACVEVEDGVFFCGENIQSLQLYDVITTPTASATPTPTLAHTQTPTPTLTATVTPTPSPSPSPTPTATLEEPFCDPPESCVGGGGEEEFPDRPHAGGRGNASWVGLFILSMAGLAAFNLRSLKRLLLKRKQP